MTQNANQIRGSKETSESAESNALTRVLDRNRMTQVRREIGMIADRSYNENLISDEAYEGYKELAEGREENKIGEEMLESTRQFAKKHEAKAIRIHQRIQSAISQKIASKADEEFLMEKLVIGNIKFTERSEEVESLIDQKLARMKKDKERYEKLASHDLIQNIGYLKVDGNTRIDFPGEDEFLELTVPERRELLKKLEEALPKAGAHAEECEAKEDKELVAGYTKKLDRALEEGIIGEHTYNSFLNGFMKIDYDEKKYWDKEFQSQMKPYRTLWTQIRSTLQGEALESMDGMMKNSGYTDLFKKFGALKQSESSRLSTDYAKELRRYQGEGAIGRHTVTQFALWMSRQDLSGKYKAKESLPDQIVRYEDLWQKIEDLPDKQQDFLRSKIDVWGFTELDGQYKKFITGEDIPTVNPKSSARNLNQLHSAEVKEAIIETNEMLEAQGGGKRKSFIRIIEKMFSRANRDLFDATSFETELRKRVIKVNPEVKQDLKGRGADDEVDFKQIEDDTEILEEAGKAKVTEDIGFIQVESSANNSKTARQTQVIINEDRGMKRFLSENTKRNYRAEDSGGSDDLSLSIYSDSGKTIELDLQEVRILRDSLEENEMDKTA